MPFSETCTKIDFLKINFNTKPTALIVKKHAFVAVIQRHTGEYAVCCDC